MGSENISGLTLPLTSNSTCKTSGFLSIHPPQNAWPVLRGWQDGRLQNLFSQFKQHFDNLFLAKATYLTVISFSDSRKTITKIVEKCCIAITESLIVEYVIWVITQMYQWHDYPNYISIRCHNKVMICIDKPTQTQEFNDGLDAYFNNIKARRGTLLWQRRGRLKGKCYFFSILRLSRNALV